MGKELGVDLRRLSIILFIFAAGMIIFSLIMRAGNSDPPPQADDPPGAAAQQASTGPAVREETQPSPAPAPAPVIAARPPVSAETLPAGTPARVKLFTSSTRREKIERIGSLDPNTHRLQVELSTRGAAIRTVELSDQFATVADKRRFYKDPATYDEALREDPKKYKGRYRLLNPVTADGQPTYLSMATGRIWIRIAGEQAPIVADLRKLNWRSTPVRTEISAGEPQSVSYSIKIFRGPDKARAVPIVRIVKTYTVTEGDYSITMTLRVENLTDKRIFVELDQAGPTGLSREDPRSDLRQAAYANVQAADRKVQNRLKPSKELSDMKLGEEHWLGGSDAKDPVLWVGHINKFFGSMIYLRPQVEGRLEAAAYRAGFYVSPAMESPDGRTFLTGMRIKQLGLGAGQSKQLAFDIFAGPKKRTVFGTPGAPYFKELYKDLNYIGTIDLSCFLCSLSWLSLTMLWLLDRFSWIAFGNYGMAIILLVLLVRLVLHPLTKKSQVSMMRMQKLAPKIQKLKEKYADDKDTLNKEMMKVYKEQGPSQLMGCLPMLLQMPIWVALYTGLNAAVELRHAAFLPFWITDLAGPDALFSWETPIPFINVTTFNLLPLLLAAAMFLQQKFSPQSAQPTASEQQQQTQKMMKYMMPGMMVVFFYKAPSGLTLYIMTSTFAGLIDQYFVRKHIREKEAAEAAEQTTISVPGKAARATRPKKPKGPFWVKRG